MALLVRSVRVPVFQGVWLRESFQLDGGLLNAGSSRKLIRHGDTLRSFKTLFHLLRPALLLTQAFELALALRHIRVAGLESFLANSQRLLVELLRLFRFTPGFAQLAQLVKIGR